MKLRITAVTCLVLLLSITAYAAKSVIKDSVKHTVVDQQVSPLQRTTINPQIKPEVLRTINTSQPINKTTAPTMSLVWHGKITANSAQQIWAMAADGVNGGRIFTSHTENQAGGVKSVLRAVSAVDGSELWKVSQPASSFSFQNLVCVDDKLLVSGSGKIRAYDPANGTKLWETPLPGTGVVTWGNSANGVIYHSLPGKYSALQVATGSYLWTHLTGNRPGAPITANGSLYVPCEASLRKVSALTGQDIKWNQGYARCDWSTPVLRGAFIYGTGPNHLYALDAGDGTILWQERMNISCLVGNTHHLVPTRKYICVLNSNSDITAHDPETGTMMWQFDGDGINNVSPLPIVNEVIFLPGKTLTALYAANGSKLWEYNPNKTGSFSAAAVVNDNLLIAQFGPELYVFAPM